MYQYMECGYKGKKLIFQSNDYGYCVASNERDPDFIGDAPDWVKKKGVGEVKVGQPVGCPKCHAWGEDNFEIT